MGYAKDYYIAFLIFMFLDPEGGSQNATLFVVVVVSRAVVVPERGGTPLRQILCSRNGAPVNVVGHRRNDNIAAFRQIN